MKFKSEFGNQINSYLIKYGEEEAMWIDNKIFNYLKRTCKKFDYQDNFRLALHADKNEIIHYNSIKNKGCCGFNDLTFGPSPKGNTYLFGFNYGH